MKRRSTASVLAVGYIVLDVVEASGLVRRSAGGTAGNVAANLAWLGVRAGVLARVGVDPAGEMIVNDLRSEGVDVTHVHRSPEVESPVLIHQIDQSGQHRYLFSCPDCGRKFAPHRPATVDQANRASEPAPKILFSDRASLASLSLMERVRATGGLVVFEPNGPGREQLTARAIALADVLKVSADRVQSLDGLIKRPSDNQLQIQTFGSEGLAYRFGSGKWLKQEPFSTNVADPGGAGDWVTAGFLACLREDGRPTPVTVPSALRFGQALASLSCRFLGARGLNRSMKQSRAFKEITKMIDIDLKAPKARSIVITPTESQRCRACLAV
jgi:fructokinase